ncbi:MAG: carboxymuconolactone decarboxylase family protein [Actinomycetota bacterium]|nr:carboxymuconolactone decarboxylase family protein [Actinomycetota bacterium]
MRARRALLNERMMEADAFFREFGALDGEAYAEGVIGRKHKELMGLGISVAARCDECVLCHIDGCRREGASREEIVEAIKIGVIAGGSITFPNARFAFAALEEHEGS